MASPGQITLFLCGDVMTGRGIDQILPTPSVPHLYEPFMRSAKGYLRLAEEKNGPIEGPADFAYIWGDALDELRRAAPDARIINLETAVTVSEEYEDKGINYRMHPANIPCITAAGIDCCCLANNHVLDWGYAGLAETIETLKAAGVRYAGAGMDSAEASSPAVIDVAGKGRMLVFSFGSESSGIPFHWAAGESRPGVNMLGDLSMRTVLSIRELISAFRRDRDIVVFSVHWGGNWGYDVQDEQRDFARSLVDKAGVDIVHGHSSHHAKGIEVHGGRLILYGCGDFLNDYEGIGGYERYRGDLGLMYIAALDTDGGGLVSLRMTPTRVRRLRVQRASKEEALWLKEILDREGRRFGTRTVMEDGNRLTLRWD